MPFSKSSKPRVVSPSASSHGSQEPDVHWLPGFGDSPEMLVPL